MKQETGPLSPMRRRAVDQLLIRYLELPESRQSAWLTGTRTRFPRLAHWLNRLIADSQTVTLLDESVRNLAGSSVETLEAPVMRLTPGTRLGPWEVLEEAGEGGMGRVYRGRRADGAFEMDVAIKLIGKRRAGLAELLQRECRLLARLDHPCVTRLVDAGLDESAGPFLVMEWVEGTGLEDWQADSQRSLDERLQLFEQIVESVSHAHQRLIVHGDIKPGNVRIRDDGTVKLMDFGVARLIDNDTPETRLRALTPSFAAPEQLKGQDITPRSDVWSLGALLYWLLSGKARAADHQVLRADLYRKYHRRGFELAAVISMATSEDPTHRYDSATDLIHEIRRLESHIPLRAMPVQRRYRVRKFLRRNPVLSGSVLLTTAMLAGGLALVSTFYMQAVFERDRAEENAWQLEQVAEFQARQLGNLDIPAMASHLRHKTDSTYESGAGRDLRDTVLDMMDTHVIEVTHAAISEHFPDQPLVKARLIQSLAASRRNLGLYEQAMPLQDEVRELIATMDTDHPLTLNEHLHRGMLLRQLGRFDEAEPELLRALEGRRIVLGPLHRDTLAAKRELAILFQDNGEIEAAGRLYHAVLDQRIQTLGSEHPETIASVMDLGVHLLQIGQPDRAEARFREALEAQGRTLGSEHPRYLTTLANLGVVVRRQGRIDEAEQLYLESLEKRRQVLGARHPDTLQSINNLAVLYLAQGEVGGAEALFRESFDGYSQVLGSDHPDALYALSTLGVVLDMQDRLDEAKQYLRQAVERRLQVHGPDHPATLVSMSSLGRVLNRLKKSAEAQEYSSHVLDKRRLIFGESHASTLLAMSNHAAVLRELKYLDEAYDLGARAVEVAREVLPAGHWQLAGHLDQHAHTLAAIGYLERAEALLVEAVELLAAALGNDHIHARRIRQNLDNLRAAESLPDNGGNRELIAGSR